MTKLWRCFSFSLCEECSQRYKS